MVNIPKVVMRTRELYNWCGKFVVRQISYWKRPMTSLILVALSLLFSGLLNIMPPKVHADIDATKKEYWVSIGPVAGSTAASYSYATLLNPAGSGRTIVAKRIKLNSDAVAAAKFQDLNLYRITSASGGTQIATTDIPKKNTNSVDSISDVRYGGVTTSAITTDARLMAVVAAGAAGNANGGRDYTFNNQQLVLQPGEGISLAQTAIGDVDQRRFLKPE